MFNGKRKETTKAKKKPPNPLSSVAMMKLRPREVKWPVHGRRLAGSALHSKARALFFNHIQKAQTRTV